MISASVGCFHSFLAAHHLGLLGLPEESRIDVRLAVCIESGIASRTHYVGVFYRRRALVAVKTAQSPRKNTGSVHVSMGMFPFYISINPCHA
jgi:hypothetical protein